MSKHVKSYQAPTREEITACAHRIYEMDGRPEGKAMEHWLQAEAQLIAERKARVGVSPAKAAPKTAASGAPSPAKTRASAWQAPASPPRQTLHRN